MSLPALGGFTTLFVLVSPRQKVMGNPNFVVTRTIGDDGKSSNGDTC